VNAFCRALSTYLISKSADASVDASSGVNLCILSEETILSADGPSRVRTGPCHLSRAGMLQRCSRPDTLRRKSIFWAKYVCAILAHPFGVRRPRDGSVRLVRNEVLHIAEDALREIFVSGRRFQQKPDDLRLIHHVQ